MPIGTIPAIRSDAVTVAASLGRTFTFDELARTLGRRASDLLAPVRELLDANLLVERDEGLAFWHDIIREAVRVSVPVTARRVLDRQAAGVLFEAGVRRAARSHGRAVDPARSRRPSPQ